MCYSAASFLKSQLREAIKQDANKDEIDELLEKLKKAEEQDLTPFKNEFYYASGFSHPYLPVITSDQPDTIQYMRWGLIPHWVKDETSAIKIANQTLNARCETIHDKPSFRTAISNRRCIVLLSGYFEYYWFDKAGKQKIPYYVRRKDNLPLYLAGVWDEWLNQESGELVKTVSIITTRANKELAQIHNRDKNNPRMLNILNHSSLEKFLKEIPESESTLFKSHNSRNLNIYPVSPLTGDFGIGDSKEAIEEKEWNLIGLPTFN